MKTRLNFLERTSLDFLLPDANIKLTIPDGFDRMLEHIAVHHYFMGLDLKRDITEKEAIIDWYEKVYMPVINVIRDTNIIREFPDKTEGDLYLWVLDHQHYLASEEGVPLQPPDEAARTFFGDEATKSLPKKKNSLKNKPQKAKKK